MQLLGSVQKVARAVVQLFGPVQKVARAVVQRLGPRLQIRRTVVQARRAVRKVARAARGLLSAFKQGVRAVGQLPRAVQQFAGAVVERLRAVRQLVHGVPQIGVQRIRVQVDLVLFPDDIGDVAGGEGIGPVRGIVHHIRLDRAGRGDVDVDLVVIGQVQRLGNAGKAIADRAAQASRGDVFAVGHGDIGEVFLVHANDRNHDKGHRHRLALAVDDDFVL